MKIDSNFKPLLQWLRQPQSELYSLYLSLMAGLFENLMFKTHFFMMSSLRRVLCDNPLALLTLNIQPLTLNKAHCAWFLKVHTSLLQLGFTYSHPYQSLFYFHTTNSTLLLLIYVDDILLIRSESSQVLPILQYLQRTFTLHDH